MDLYQKVLKDLPWSSLKSSLNNLEQYRNDYSSSAADIISEIKGHMSSGIEAYKRSSRNIYDWCNFAVQRLDSYIQLFNGLNSDNIQKQKQILIVMLDEGIKRMNMAQDELYSSSLRYWKLNLWITHFMINDHFNWNTIASTMLPGDWQHSRLNLEEILIRTVHTSMIK